MCPVCYLVSFFLIAMAHLKPTYFWRSEQALRVRGWFGDQGATIFYYALGGFMLSVGIILSVA